MNLVIGIALFMLGIFALVAWFSELVPFLKGVLVGSLLFWGAVVIIVGVAQRRARGHLQKAAHDKPSEAEKKAD